MLNFSRPVKRILTILALLIISTTPCLVGSALSLHMSEQIASKKSITLGYQDDAFPFPWQNGNVPAGYSINIYNSIISVFKTKLQSKSLKVGWAKTNLVSQFVLIRNHMVGTVCTSAFYPKSRYSINESSLPFYFSSTRFVMRKGENDDDLAELSRCNILVESSTIHAEQPQKVNTTNDLDANTQLDINSITASNELKNSEYSALISGTVLLKRIIVQTPNPGDYRPSDIAFSAPLPVGLLLPLHDKEFKESVGGTLPSLMASNESTTLYNKQFQPPTPPKAADLNIPMLDNLKALTSAKKEISFNYKKYN